MIPAQFLDILKTYGKEICLPPNTALDFQRNANGIPSVTYFLSEGICAMTGRSKLGEEMIYSYFRSGCLCPLGFIPFSMKSINSQKNTPSLFTVTKTACVLYQVPSRQLTALLSTPSEFTEQVMYDIYTAYQNAFLHSKQMQEETTLVNVCRLLITVAETKNDKKIVPKFFTYAEIAKYIGKHHITVSRIMSDLRRDGYIIKTSSGTIIQREQDLIQMIQENSAFQY